MQEDCKFCISSDSVLNKPIVADHSSLESKPANPRSRSNTAVSTKSRKRPLSRASTTSVHSSVTQPMVNQQFVDPAAEFQKSWYDQNTHGHQRFGSMSHQMTTEDMVISQLQNPREYDIDPALGMSQNHSLAYPHDASYNPESGGRKAIPRDTYSVNYAEVESQMIEGRSDEQDDVDSQVGTNGPAKKASKSSAANELEMRQLFQANKNRTLPDVAAELHGNERGPNSERQRQVFAMLW